MKTPCTLFDELPSPAEYNRLRKAVGWAEYQENVIAKSLPNSLYCVCAYQGFERVGMARVIGDGGMVYYIQDVIVIPECQGQGIGAQMMERIMVYINAHASEHSIVGLMAAKGKERFYEKYGFIQRPNDRAGCGMTFFWTNKEDK